MVPSLSRKALTGPLDPDNEGSFGALKVIIPEGNVMMAKFPAPMSGWSAIVPTRRGHDRGGARQGDAGPCSGWPSWPARRICRVLRAAPKTKRRFIVQVSKAAGGAVWPGMLLEGDITASTPK
jgi:hypothetical protein